MTDQKTTAVAARAADSDFARPTASQFPLVPHMEMFERPELFTHYQRVAALMASALIVPKHFQGKPADVFIALSIARATAQDPMVVMQNIYVADGRAGWYSKYLIARANMSGRLKPPGIRFEITRGDKPLKANNADWPDITVRAYAHLSGVEGDDLIEQTVSMRIAIDDGWIRNPKYRSIPERMLTWRAASWLVNAHIPEVMLGMPTAEEVEDGALDDDIPEAPARREPRPRRDDFRAGAVDAPPARPAETSSSSSEALGSEMIPVVNTHGEVVAESQDMRGAMTAFAGEVGRAKTEADVNGLFAANDHLHEAIGADMRSVVDDRIAEIARAPKPAADKPKETKPREAKPAEQAKPAEAAKPVEQAKPAEAPPADEPEKIDVTVKSADADLPFVLPDDLAIVVEAFDGVLVDALNNGGFAEATRCWEANLPVLGALRKAGFSKEADGIQDRNADRIKRAKKAAAETAAATGSSAPAASDAPPADASAFDDIPIVTAGLTPNEWTAKFGEFNRVLRGDAYADKPQAWFQAFADRNKPVVEQFMGAMKTWAGPLRKAFEYRGVKV